MENANRELPIPIEDLLDIEPEDTGSVYQLRERVYDVREQVNDLRHSIRRNLSMTAMAVPMGVTGILMSTASQELDYILAAVGSGGVSFGLLVGRNAILDLMRHSEYNSELAGLTAALAAYYLQNKS